jgi:hypothetical protein
VNNPDDNCTVCGKQMPEDKVSLSTGPTFGAICSMACMINMLRRKFLGSCPRCAGAAGAGAAVKRHGFCQDCWKAYEERVQ